MPSATTPGNARTPNITGNAASDVVTNVNPFGPITATSCAMGVSAQMCPINAQGKPVSTYPRASSIPASATPKASARCRTYDAIHAAQAQNNANPNAMPSNAKGAIHA